jgi:transposase
VYNWIHSYEKTGLQSFAIKNGRGRKAVMDELSEEQVEIVRTKVASNPQSLRNVCAELSSEFGLNITKISLKNFLKKNSATVITESVSG